MLKSGDAAPAFRLRDENGQWVSLSDFAGKAVIFYAYPKALTPGCTTQACDFRDSQAAWQSAGYQVLGISPDEPELLTEFSQTERVPYPFLSDPDHAVLEAYGAWGEKENYGKKYMGVIRSTFVIDVDDSGAGTIRIAQYNVQATGHVDRLLKSLKISA